LLVIRSAQETRVGVQLATANKVAKMIAILKTNKENQTIVLTSDSLAYFILILDLSVLESIKNW
jgi:hypothetical protein